MSNPEIDALYDLGLQNGSLGGKVIGAGGGGFFMFYTEEPQKLRKAMKEKGISELRYNFEFDGTHLLTK
jgi:D-glycero-alpha-D-manno-heptose-7-phosphate kinase